MPPGREHIDALVAENVSRTFTDAKGRKTKALDRVSLRVGEGTITALVGPDGSGKTTMLRIIAGLIKEDSGQLTVFGMPHREKLEEIQAQLGYMPQKFGLYEDLTVRENLDLYADLRGLPGNLREERYAELLEMTAMSPFQTRLAGKLSGGMKQKLGLICTLVQPPRLLLLDEPTVGVDPLSRRELWAIVEQLALNSGMSVVLSTSYLDEAERCDEVILLSEGAALARGTPSEIRDMSKGMGYMVRPQQDVQARNLQSRLLSLEGIIDAVPRGGEVRLVHGDLAGEQQAKLDEALSGASVEPSPPVLEDSFMMLLRKKGKEANSSPKTGISRDISKPGAGDNEVIIETKNVYRYFGDFIAVNDVSFSVRKGEVFGLLGPNGAGKTTTFRMLCGLLPASKGELKVAGVDVRKAREEARKRLGYVAQKFSLYGTLSCRENLEFFAGAYGLRGKRQKERIDSVVGDFSLGNSLDIPAGDLPGGYKQRLAMATGLLHEPSILFLDEPTSGADPLARREFWQRISALSESGVTIIVTTHFMEEAEYCDRVLIQSDGVMLALDTPANIRANAAGTSHETMEDAFISIVEQGRRKEAGDGPKE